MITARQSRITAILLNADSWIPGAVFSDMLGISLRTLQSEVKSLNALFRSMRINAYVTSNNRLGYRFEGDRTAVRRRLARTESETVSHGQSQRDILAVLLFETDYLTIGALADRIFLAKSSVNANLSEIRRILDQKQNISLDVHPRRGLKLNASEEVKRILCAEILADSMCGFLSCAALPDAFYDLDEMRRILIDVFAPVDHIMEGAGFELIARCCVFSIARSLAGFEIRMSGKAPLSERMHEVRALTEARLHYRFTDSELVFLQRYIRRFNVIGITKTDDSRTEEEIHEFLSIIRRETGIELSVSEKDLKRFSETLQRTRYRMENGLETIIGPGTEEQLDYPVALHFVHTVLSRAMKLPIPETETGRIVPFISSMLEDLRPKTDVYIVSDLPVSMLYRYRKRLRGYYDYYIRNIFLIPMYLYEQRYRVHDEESIFLTTDPNLFFEEEDMYYLDLTDEIIAAEHLRQVFRNHLAKMREEAVRAFRSRFAPAACSLSASVNEPAAICREAGCSVSPNRTDTLLLRDGVAAVLVHGKGNHMHAVFGLSDPVLYKGHTLHTVHYVYCGSEKDPYYFFEYIRLALNNRI